MGTARTRPRVLLLSIDPWVGPREGFRPFNYSVRKIQAVRFPGRAPGDIGESERCPIVYSAGS